jgi:hypothetical protein
MLTLQVQVDLPEPNGSGGRVDHPRCNGLGGLDVGQRPEHSGEFVAAQPGGQIIRSSRRRQATMRSPVSASTSSPAWWSAVSNSDSPER